jgi:hypothetical protein
LEAQHTKVVFLIHSWLEYVTMILNI